MANLTHIFRVELDAAVGLLCGIFFFESCGFRWFLFFSFFLDDRERSTEIYRGGAHHEQLYIIKAYSNYFLDSYGMIYSAEKTAAAADL